MPSKWDEAERWICSPVSAAESRRRSSRSQLQRRPKSISGPIVPPPPPGVVAANFYSPGIQHHQGFVVRNLMVGSPFSTGVLAPVAVSVHHYYDPHGHDVDDGVSVYGCDIDNVGMQYAGPVHSSTSTVPMCPQLPPSPLSTGIQARIFENSSIINSEVEINSGDKLLRITYEF